MSPDTYVSWATLNGSLLLYPSYFEYMAVAHLEDIPTTKSLGCNHCIIEITQSFIHALMRNHLWAIHYVFYSSHDKALFILSDLRKASSLAPHLSMLSS